MGGMGAMAMAGSVEDKEITLDQALIWHLQSNHYPPIPVSMVKPCKTAIRLAKMGRWDSLVSLPDGVSFRGKRKAPVYEMVRAHHLNHFID